MKYDLSVIIPFYNIGFLIERLLLELLSIQKINVEIILVNDGSVDNSRAVCEKYLSYQNIKYIETNHRGVSHARNVGMDVASGNYITFMDADDLIEHKVYEAKVSEFLKLNFEMLMYSFYVVFDDRVEVRKFFSEDKLLSLGKREIEDKLLMKLFYPIKIEGFINDYMWGAVWASIFSSKYLKDCKLRFNEEVKVGEDTLFIFECLSKCKEVMLSNDCLYKYMRNNTLQSTTQGYVEDVYKSTEVMYRVIMGCEYAKKNYSLTKKYMTYRNVHRFYSAMFNECLSDKSVLVRCNSIKKIAKRNNIKRQQRELGFSGMPKSRLLWRLLFWYQGYSILIVLYTIRVKLKGYNW
ncbi:MAG: glycosyltransferase [Sarcina sp.]